MLIITKMAWVLVAACLTVATTAGCSGDGVAPAPAEGMQRVRGSGYVFDLPKTWVKGADRKPDIIWICPEDERVNGFGTNVNVMVYEAGKVKDVHDVVDEMAQGVGLVGGRDVKQLGDAKLDGEPAVRLTSMLDTDNFVVRNTALVALHEGKSYVVTFTGEGSMPQAELQKMADASIATWHWAR